MHTEGLLCAFGDGVVTEHAYSVVTCTRSVLTDVARRRLKGKTRPLIA